MEELASRHIHGVFVCVWGDHQLRTKSLQQGTMISIIFNIIMLPAETACY
jgi:hypothetical protein